MKQYTFLQEFAIDSVSKMRQNVLSFKNDKRNNNCQKFALCLENLISTGDKISPTPSETPTDIAFDVPVGHSYPYFNWCFMKHGKFEKFKGNVEKSIKNKLMSLPDQSRLFLSVAWSNSHAGHVFNAWRYKQDVYIMDAMTSYFGKLEDSKEYTTDIDINKSNGMLVCNPKDYDYNMRDKALGIKSYKYTIIDIENDKKFNKKYFSILEALSCVGKNNTTYQVIENGKNLGKIRTVGIEHKYGNYWTVYKYNWL